MHELSIAMNIVDIAEEYAIKENAKVVREIEIEVGTLSGVVIELLKFAMEMTVKETILENSKITLLNIPARTKCLNCSENFNIEEYYSPCPNCKNYHSEIIQGKELKVKSLYID